MELAHGQVWSVEVRHRLMERRSGDSQALDEYKLTIGHIYRVVLVDPRDCKLESNIYPTHVHLLSLSVSIESMSHLY